MALSSCDMGTDFLGRVLYPNNTLVNANYISECDDVMYMYVRNQRCIALKKLRSRLMEGGDDE